MHEYILVFRKKELVSNSDKIKNREESLEQFLVNMPSVKPRVNPKNRNVEPFDRMLRRFKKQCERINIVNEVRDRQYYEKPNQKNKKNQEIARRKKLIAQDCIRVKKEVVQLT